MFAKFNFIPSNAFYNNELNPCLTLGNQMYSEHQKEVQDCLSEYITEEGIINGSALKEHWFSISQKDIFISHSHKDIHKVKAFAGWLKLNFGLEAFIDSCSWGYCDELLNKIDKKYCYKPKTKTYDYNLRNYTTLIHPESDMKDIYDIFYKLYEQYLGRELQASEKVVLSSAVKIMIWKVYGKTFHLICQYRYSYTSRVTERRKLYNQGKIEEANTLKARYLVGCHDLPDKNLKPYPLISSNVNAKDVDYDLIVYDTYDYLDKLIGFKLSDIFYAMFHQFYEKTNDENALKLAKYFKYGTDKEREIWMLRYGLTFEDIEWADQCIDSIDESEIRFNDKVLELDDLQKRAIEQYLHTEEENES